MSLIGYNIVIETDAFDSSVKKYPWKKNHEKKYPTEKKFRNFFFFITDISMGSGCLRYIRVNLSISVRDSSKNPFLQKGKSGRQV